MKKVYLLFIIWMMALGITAQDDGLVMHFDFSKVSGTSVTDVGTSGIAATLMNQAKVEEMGKYHVLDLGAGTGYLDLSAQAGKLLQQTDTFTISVYYRVDANATLTGNGFFLWAFSTSTDCQQSAGKYSAYRLNAQRYATSTGGYSHETGIEKGGASAKGKWIHVAYTQAGTTATLYINGTKVGSIASMPQNSNNYTGETVQYNWLGRSPFSADLYLQNTLVSDFRFYNRALTADEVTKLSAVSTDMDDAYLHGIPGDVTALKTAITSAETSLQQSSKYLPGAVNDLEDALTSAKAIAKGGYTQIIIDNELTKLQSAQTAMITTEGVTFVSGDGFSQAYDTNRGFLHPGGLHTQADFDRIKQQLADHNSTVSAAYEILKNAEYAQPGVATWPVEGIIRGGSSGQNYINAARGATMAYQNALRWKIEGNQACAAAAVRILMSWANVTKYIGGDSNYALAAGLYGYQFAQAAELVRDQFTQEQFATFKKWMLDVWYPAAIGFLRGRNGTWENSANKPAAGWGDAGNRPGHYWSNWGLCNTLCVMSIGILCDDVFLYNQGMSYFKYDQVGSYVNPRTAVPILNDGLTEFLGNLVVTTAQTPDTLQASSYGIIGQMQESGRDVGHANMALGLAVDIAHVGWNQGDDLFSYMNNRLTAGIEFTAAMNCGNSKLPWMDYKYCDCRTAWHSGWYMSGPSVGSQVRNYWGTIIGHYEGVMGKRLPYAEQCLSIMGIDAGGVGSVSGNFDHLGYSVLMNTYNGLAQADSVPTMLTPQMIYNGDTIAHNELGGLKNTYIVDTNIGLPKGSMVKLMPQLPAGETDTGKWSWNTGATTKDITVTANKSYIYRATYTNQHGVKSQQAFSLAVQGDCTPADKVTITASQNGTTLGTDTVTVYYGSSLNLSVGGTGGWGTCLWDNGKTSSSITTAALVRDRDFAVNYVNQGGAISYATIHVKVQKMTIQTIVNDVAKPDTVYVVVKPTDKVVIGPYVPDALPDVTYLWSDGSTERTVAFNPVQTSRVYILNMTMGTEKYTLRYNVVVDSGYDADIQPGTYLIRNRQNDSYLTDNQVLGGKTTKATFEEAQEGTSPSSRQIWEITKASGKGYNFQSYQDSLYMNIILNMSSSSSSYGFLFRKAVGADYYSLHNTMNFYMNIATDGSITMQKVTTLPNTFDVELVPYTVPAGIATVISPVSKHDVRYNLSGQRVGASYRGTVIENGRKLLIK